MKDERVFSRRGISTLLSRQKTKNNNNEELTAPLPPKKHRHKTVEDELNFEGMKKKKKKKDKSKDGGGGGEGKGDGGSGGALAFGLDDLFDASGAPAKKKRRVRGPPRPDAAFGETASGMGEGGAGGAGASGVGVGGGEAGDDAAGASSSSSASASAVAAAAALPWAGSDRDYTYAELLDRVFATLRANNPELTGEKRRTLMKPPQVAREGTKKTVFANFAELCKAMNRPGEHVQAFLLAELGTSGNLDGQSRLIVKGRFLPKVIFFHSIFFSSTCFCLFVCLFCSLTPPTLTQHLLLLSTATHTQKNKAFEGTLRRYVNEYVLCNSCKSPDSLLDRDSSSRIMFLRCQACGASRTVAPIKAGFVARTTRRPKVG